MRIFALLARRLPKKLPRQQELLRGSETAYSYAGTRAESKII